jgi:hypothetical protein
MAIAYSYGGFLDAQGYSVPGSLNIVELLVGLTTGINVVPWLSLHGFVEAGPAVGLLSSGTNGVYAVARAGGGLGFSLGDSWVADLDAAWEQQFGVYGGLGLTLGVGYRLPGPSQQTVPSRIRLLEISSVSAGAVYPIFRSYYDDHPVATAKLTNTGTTAATDVHVRFVIKQYMDAPKECAVIPKVEPGQSVEIPLYALFNDQILSVTEATKVSAEVSLQYSSTGEESRAVTVLVYDRNALTWDDDRHAAAFVSAKDPWVLDLAGNALAAVRDARNGEVCKNMQTAIAFHEGLRAYGISYVLAPNRPFARPALTSPLSTA